MKQQTAMQELIEKLSAFKKELKEKYDDDPYVIRGITIALSEANALLEKEQQQIIKAINTCDNILIKNEIGIEANANGISLGEQFYNETYGGEK